MTTTLLKTSLALTIGSTLGAAAAPGPLNNTFAKLEQGEPVRIVVVGNSVTHGAPLGQKRTTSFYWALYDWLHARYPGADIQLQTSIIFAIGPELQLFRMPDKVFRHQPDLVLAEFGAANGAWGAAGREVTDPATEGYIRLLRQKLPYCDIILQLGLFKTMMDHHEKGQVPPTARFLQDLAEKYDCLVADGQQEMARRIVAGAPWEDYMKDAIHPGEAGYRLHSEVLRAALERAHSDYRQHPQPLRAHRLSGDTLHPKPWVKPLLVPSGAAADVQDFAPVDFGRFRGQVAQSSGATLRFQPATGRVYGLLLRRPAKPGGLEILHNGAWKQLSLRQAPRAMEEDDPDSNPIIRHFWHSDGLPLSFAEIQLRSVIEQEGESVEILGFLVVE
jgi:lysophospholipase L1-like esterase